MARLRQPWRQRPSASDSNFRCRKGKWFRLRKPGLHRFLISGGKLGNHCRESPRFGPGAAVILDFRLRIENHCKIFPGNVPKSAVILDFRGQFGNRCNGCCRHRRMARLQHNRRGGGEWPACVSRGGSDRPRPILIFPAATGMRPPVPTCPCRDSATRPILTQRNS